MAREELAAVFHGGGSPSGGGRATGSLRRQAVSSTRRTSGSHRRTFAHGGVGHYRGYNDRLRDAQGSGLYRTYRERRLRGGIGGNTTITTTVNLTGMITPCIGGTIPIVTQTTGGVILH